MKLGGDTVVKVGDAEVGGDREVFQLVHAGMFHHELLQACKFEQASAVADGELAKVGEFGIGEQGKDFVEGLA